MTDDLVKRLHKWVDDLEHDRDYDLEFELSGEEAGNFANDICGMLTRIEKLEAGEEEWNRICNRYAARIDKLEAALQLIAETSDFRSTHPMSSEADYFRIARKALDAK